MNETQTRNLSAIEDLEQYQRTLPGPDWLRDLRSAALARFSGSEWPTTSEEEWRRTNLSPFEFEVYSLVPRASESTRGGADGAGRSGTIDYEDGVPVRSSVLDEVLDRGVVFGGLLEVVEANPQIASEIRATLERSLFEADNRLEYWHFAMLVDAAVLYVPADVTIEEPFEVNVTVHGDEVVHAPHFIAIIGRGAGASVIRRVSGAEEGELLVVDSSEFVIGEGANLRYLNLQRLNDESVYFANDHGNVGRDARIHRTEVALGSDFVKTRFVSELTGAGADAVLNGIYFGMNEQHLDLRTVQKHRAPHTTSRAFYRGVVRDESHAIYQGLIQVDGTAPGTDAYLTNKNLILSDEARADSIPSLNISTDDVRCSHGSTTGKLDQNQIFYLRSRGYTLVEAKRLLVEGYFEDLVSQTHPSVHEELRALIMERIPQDS